MLKRIIPILLVENQELIKTIKFKNPTYIGDLLNSVKIYNELEVDELVILDKSASRNGIDFDLISQFANESFSPLSYGGGIKKINDIEKLLRLGIEKVIISSSSIDKSFVKEAVSTFGGSTITICLDYKCEGITNRVYVNNGLAKTEFILESLMSDLADLGVGEFIVHSIDRDGTYLGYDLKLIESFINNFNNPVVVCGGCQSITDVKNAFNSKVSGAAAGSLFVYYSNIKGILINYPTQNELIEIGIKR